MFSYEDKIRYKSLSSVVGVGVVLFHKSFFVNLTLIAAALI